VELAAYVKAFVADGDAGVSGAEDVEVGGWTGELGVALEKAGSERVEGVCGDDACDEDEKYAKISWLVHTWYSLF